MEQKIKTNTIDKTEAKEILDRTLGFINNCDNKTAIILGIYGIIISILFSSDSITNFVCYIKTTLINDNTSVKVFVFLGLKILFLFPFSFGLYKLILVLIARLKNQEQDSHIYFNDIARYSNSKQYKEKLVGLSEEGYFDDLIAQVYVNSKICSRKFRAYKTGLICSIVGLFGFLIACLLELII